MPKTPPQPRPDRPSRGPEVSRKRILESTLAVLAATRSSAVTVDAIAKAAGCAKGLVHYHFKTKDSLLAAAAEHMWAGRTEAWRAALTAEDPDAALASAWTLLTREATDGTATACVSLGIDAREVVGRTVKAAREAFVRSLAEALVDLLGAMGRSATVPPRELATLLAAVIEGVGLQSATGTRTDALEPAWSAFWAGLLSLTRSR